MCLQAARFSCHRHAGICSCMLKLQAPAFSNTSPKAYTPLSAADRTCAACRTFPAPPNAPHTLSIDFAPDTNGNNSAEDLVIAGIEVGGCLVMTPDQVWESRHGQQEIASVARVGGQTLDSLPDALKTLTHTNTSRPQLCTDVHQCRPDPFDPSRSV